MMNNRTESLARVPLFLVIANVVGVLIGYAITILLARSLSHGEFEQYIGAVATLGLLASAAEGGFGKYGLKIVPVYIANQSIDLLAGYMRFALFGSLVMSVVLGWIAASIETPMRTGNTENLILLAIVFLPAMAGVGVTVDLLLSFRMAVIATLISRILVPLTTLSLVVVNLAMAEITPLRAVLSFATGSLVGFLLALVLCLRKSRSLTSRVSATTDLFQWITESLSFWAFGFLTAWIFRATLVLTHYLPHGRDDLAMLAPALETGCLILLLSKSTDKFYQPAMSVILATSDWEHGVRFRRNRYIFVGYGVIAFLAVILLFGDQILGLYGKDFGSAYPELCLIAIGSSIWTLFSLAPAFLQFAGERKVLLFSLLGHGTLLAVLTVGLLPTFGATGAAAAFTISISSLAIVNVFLANQRFRKMEFEVNGATAIDRDD
tara:strand:- start:69316 stop:70623 length:1308 start_codon:yes stop_codon:yes gene_type:complete